MKTISYSGPDGAVQQADLNLPEGDGPFPLILGVSGGGWIRVHRGVLAQWGQYFAQHGFAFANVDYRRASAGKPLRVCQGKV
ncbi:alpha/beta hydrolase family protein, partial [Rhizobium sp.]|uniref:alpha/beta hydrolase family protein n=1 Tax=Rhizobium sp. TaxID=391 RepID=UPI000E8D6636|nr:hypothetical protein [Rhizobium sp.]